MKNLDENGLDQLFELIAIKPGTLIVHFCDEDSTFMHKLNTLCEANEYEYQVNCIENTSYEVICEKYKDKPFLKPIKMPLARPRYLVRAKHYDYLFATFDFLGQDKAAFLEKCYPIIRTGGEIVILIPKSNYMTQDDWIDTLVEKSYVSINIIDNIFENHDVIVAKRMHGWGN